MGEVEAGDRPLLPAALAADRMLSSLLLWAAHLAPFATHLVGEWTTSFKVSVGLD